MDQTPTSAVDGGTSAAGDVNLAPHPPLGDHCRVAIVGAGPVGLALALLLASRTHHTQVCVFDTRSADHDVSHDARTLALSLGSVQLLERLGAWDAARAQPIQTVHVSQHGATVHWPSSWPLGGGEEASVTLRASEMGVPALGAVLPYGALVSPLQRAWFDAVALAPARLSSRFGVAVKGVKPLPNGSVEVDAGVAEPFDLVVIAEGGVFADQARKALVHDYQQTAWVGRVNLDGASATPGMAFERFTRHGPAALLPLPPLVEHPHRAALVWCVPSLDDPVRDLSDAQRVAVLNTIFPRQAGRITSLAAPLKAFPLGLNAERTLVDRSGPIVRIGNAAQTLHPVAGQGLNLGLRDAHALADALRNTINVREALTKVEWQRAPDRWALIAGTDFLARSFTWGLPGLGAARGAALALLDRAGPLKSLLAKQMMFGSR